jgi:hypothetical protein
MIANAKRPAKCTAASMTGGAENGDAAAFLIANPRKFIAGWRLDFQSSIDTVLPFRYHSLRYHWRRYSARRPFLNDISGED